MLLPGNVKEPGWIDLSQQIITSKIDQYSPPYGQFFAIMNFCRCRFTPCVSTSTEMTFAAVLTRAEDKFLRACADLESRKTTNFECVWIVAYGPWLRTAFKGSPPWKCPSPILSILKDSFLVSQPVELPRCINHLSYMHTCHRLFCPSPRGSHLSDVLRLTADVVFRTMIVFPSLLCSRGSFGRKHKCQYCRDKMARMERYVYPRKYFRRKQLGFHRLRTNSRLLATLFVAAKAA